METHERPQVLLVDDEPQVLLALEDLLSEHFDIFTTSSGEEALLLLAERPRISVVVTDQRMPRMTGDELLNRIARDTDALGIMVTGFADLSGVIRAVNAGRVFAYVTKPWDRADLLTKVTRAAEKLQLARDLAHERQLLRDLMDNIPDGIYFKDAELRFMRANRAYAEQTGVSDPEFLVGKTLSEVLGHTAARETEQTEREILGSGHTAVDVVRSYQLRSSRHWLSETRAPIRNHTKAPLGLVGISRDVTERIKTAEALRASEQLLRDQTQILNSILNSMSEGVVVVDLHGKFVLKNPTGSEILAVALAHDPAADWKTAFARSVEDSGLGEGTPDPLAQVVQRNAPASVEVKVARPDGSLRAISITAAPLRDQEQRLVGAVAVLRDVSEQRRLERDLLQSQKLEAIGRLAGGIAHDFNNLLVVIQAYAEFILDKLAGPDAEEDGKEMLAAIDRAAALTHQLLAFSRRRPIQPESILIDEVVMGMEKLLRRTLGEDVELSCESDDSQSWIRADRGQLEQVILNLAVNARDAMPNGGQLQIRIRRADPAESEKLPTNAAFGHSVLSVSDQGKGMDAKTQEQIFEPFFTTKDVGRGTGLGLATVYGIVQQSSGHIRVESEVGKGTRFDLYFPVVLSAAEPPRVSLPAPAQRNARGTILLVEDDRSVRTITARILRACGYTVLEASDTADARQLASQHADSIDLLLTDVIMPGETGPQLAESLRVARPSLNVVYMSGHTGGAVGPEGQAPQGYLDKPFSARDLIDAVQSHLTHSPST
jgi:two-component system, cell cycle sensor histidine kinase and response regulator CckA